MVHSNAKQTVWTLVLGELSKVFDDNQGAVLQQVAKNPVKNSISNHIDIHQSALSEGPCFQGSVQGFPCVLWRRSRRHFLPSVVVVGRWGRGGKRAGSVARSVSRESTRFSMLCVSVGQAGCRLFLTRLLCKEAFRVHRDFPMKLG